MTDRDLLALDQIGFIPGPEEEEKDFLHRVAQSKARFGQGEWIPESHWHSVRESLYQIFNVKPLYICAFYSNRRLPPWQGGAAWVEGRSIHSVQLRKGLEKGPYLGLYRREEILAHEAIHAARSGFTNSRYEEFFAYMTSEKPWRRVLGPIVRRPWEAWPFLLLVTAGILWPASYLGAATWLTLGFGRLIRGHWRLRKAAAQIFEQTKDLQITRAVLLRLTDEEIEQFAEGIDIESLAQKHTCLRWRILRNYLKGTVWLKKS